jgi:hypothetical protein
VNKVALAVLIPLEIDALQILTQHRSKTSTLSRISEKYIIDDVSNTQRHRYTYGNIHKTEHANSQSDKNRWYTEPIE